MIPYVPQLPTRHRRTTNIAIRRLLFLGLLAAAVIYLAACESVKSAYCTAAVPLLTKPCLSATPPSTPTLEVK